MEFRIADTFTQSLARLTGDEQKAVKTTAFDLQLNPASPGLSFHKIDRTKDKNFWSMRVSRDIRLIVHKTAASLLLCYVDHHDKAYAWTERRKLETHPKTGAAQLVEIRETIKEVVIPQYVERVEVMQSGVDKLVYPFQKMSVDELLGFGVPPEWVDAVQTTDEDSILEMAEHLPAEAAEALLEITTGGKPAKPAFVESGVDPFEHPDAQRRFRVLTDVEELERALEFPWEKWALFLHPVQRQIAEREYSGAMRVSGTAGTGKTVVALHRAVYLAQMNPDARILLTTYSEELAQALRVKLRRLIGSDSRLGERIDVDAIGAVAKRLHARSMGKVRLIEDTRLSEYLAEAAAARPENTFGQTFLRAEWTQVVDAWQLSDWESYRDVKRLGRKTRLPEIKREELWSIFTNVQTRLRDVGETTEATLFTALANKLKVTKNPPYDFAVIDEAQDLTVSQIKFLAALGGGRPQSLFFSGDLGQRIFQQPFSWASLGIDLRGRAQTLRINYRTSHQIRLQADRLLDPEIADVDGNIERRDETISVFNGPSPIVRCFASADEEIKAVSRWLKERVSEGFSPNEMGVFVRSDRETRRAELAIESAGLKSQTLTQKFETRAGTVSLSLMHLAKGLEFRAVVVMACDDEVIPSQERIEQIGDNTDLDEVYNTERHLLYVACTRARENLLVTSIDPASEFLDDLNFNKTVS